MSIAGQGILLQRKCACGGSPGLGGECEECRKKKMQGIQTKLAIGEPGDAYEREADRIADQVLAMPPRSTIGVAPTRIQRFAGQPAGQAGTAPASVDRTLAGSGRPLDLGLRQDMEARFGYDFSRVRVHTGAEAEQSAREVDAHAYTVGCDIVFGAGRFAPETREGQRLLAHELTHVLQQGEASTVVQRDLIYGSGYPNPFVGNPSGEAGAAKKGEWFPSSVDFAETAKLSGGDTGISTLAKLLAEIGGKAAGSIQDLDLIGHANGDLFALAGTITRTSVSGSRDGTIGVNQLAAAQPEIDKVRDRFASGGRITIYGCNSGASGTLLQALSMAFKVCARGFKDAITWCLGWQTKPFKINSRGRTLINPPAGTPCDQFNGSIYNLSSDTEDCSGTKRSARSQTESARGA
jgi:hypothetical protein